MEFRIVPFGTPAYTLTVVLRYDILRKPLGLQYNEAQLAPEYADHHLSLWEGDTVVAVLVMTAVDEHVVKMRQFAVREGRQRQGLGSRLVAEAEAWAKAQGYQHIYLHARETAIAFYLGLGYQVESDWFEEVGIPHKKMHKALL